ncbi:TPA: quinol oxidase [Streptococcus suis]
MTELDTTSENATNKGKYRRQRKNSQSQELNLNEEFNDKLLDTKIWPAIIWSLLLSILSVANPFLTSLATNIQTQNLYAGMAMMFGQVPYGNFFGTNGVLYYLLAWLGHIEGGFLVFGLLQFIFLVIAGIYFYKIIAYFGQSDYLATSFSHWFYIFIFALGFGGLYAEIFVLPFVLGSIWFLVRYFANAVTDEAFILYGIEAALAFLIYPKSLLLWLLAGFILFIFNTQHRQMARGFYQLLASIFGLLFILYSVGYYAFEAQILGTAIQQTFLYNLGLDFQYAGLYVTLAVVGGFLLLSGFFKGLIQIVFSFGQGRHNHIKVLMLLVFIIQLVSIIGTSNSHYSQLLSLLPYGFVLTVLHLSGDSAVEERGYLRHQFFLPLLMIFGIVAQPAYTYFVEGDLVADRASIASYVGQETNEDDKIYVWDDSASIYLDSQRLSSATITTAEPYLTTTDNQNSLVYDLNKNEASLIIVNKNIPLLDDVKANVELQYKSVKTTDYFTVYQKNE